MNRNKAFQPTLTNIKTTEKNNRTILSRDHIDKWTNPPP